MNARLLSAPRSLRWLMEEKHWISYIAGGTPPHSLAPASVLLATYEAARESER